ncbi:MAG: hypothetical protein KGD70_00730 [Candidatus Lokiarchaeota archaeon]|jgi:hypothetical protein|nr:hypothetical protein [Candidatus Lokiarchaeota archaeon]
MSKIRKDPTKSESNKRKPKFIEKAAYRSVIFSGILGGLFLVISIMLNGEFFIIFTSDDLLWVSIDVLLKVITILFFYFFMMISIGNYKELTGKPLDLKIILLIFFLSLIQSFKNSMVFSFTLIGLLVIVVYLYVVQDN